MLVLYFFVIYIWYKRMKKGMKPPTAKKGMKAEADKKGMKAPAAKKKGSY